MTTTGGYPTALFWHQGYPPTPKIAESKPRVGSLSAAGDDSHGGMRMSLALIQCLTEYAFKRTLRNWTRHRRYAVNPDTRFGIAPTPYYLGPRKW